MLMPKCQGKKTPPAAPADLVRVWSATLAALLLAVLVTGSTTLMYESSRMQARRQVVTDLTRQLSHDLHDELNLSLSATYALAAMIRQGNGEVEDFPQLAKEMLDLYKGVSALQLAPNGIISQVVPLQGNEKAIGHNLLEDGKRNKEAMLAWRSRSLTLAGPFELLQGGMAAVGRLPVFIKDEKGTERFWGFSIVLIRMEDFLKTVDLHLLGNKYSCRISRIHPDTDKEDVFWSAGNTLKDPVVQKIRVPNGEWTVSVEPVEGWYEARVILGEVFLVLLLSTVSALAAFWLTRQPVVLRRMVDERTRELSESNARLQAEIGERRHAEEALQASEHKLRSIFASLTDVIMILDAEGRCVEIAPTSAKGLYRPPDELQGKRISELFPPDQAGFFLAAIDKTLSTGESMSVDYKLEIGGEEVWFAGNVTPMSENMVVWSARDITRRKRSEDDRLKLEKQMLHTQKLESLGVLAGGIAHDFNNILTSIVGNADLALMRLKPESPAIENLHRIESAAARASELARQMLAYSGKGRFVIEDLDLNRLVEEMGHMLEVSISKKALLRYNHCTPLPSMRGDATQIRQIVMNLVINASEAIGDKSGVISLTTGCLECNDAYLRDSWLSDPIPEGLYVFLEVSDTGCGMERETMAKIFDPFFTTKFTGRGLGMAAVLGIVRGHQGAIKVYSEPGRGSTFRIMFPAGSMPAELFGREDDNDRQWHGSGTVLLVDDEETVRALGSEMLKVLGYEVVTADDGRQGVEIFKARRDIGLVLLDLTMPHMDGEQCFRALRQVDPQVKVVMSSGFNEQEVTQKFLGKGISGFVQKPYKLSMLREVLSRIGGD